MTDASSPPSDATPDRPGDPSTVIASDTTPEPAPLPSEPVPPEGEDVASVTLEDVQANEELSRFIASADRVMDAMGFTEHGFRHANLVARIAFQVLARLGYGEREATLACVAGYLHDVGNALARDAHGQTGAVIVHRALRDSVAPADLMPILAAIANHEETEGTAVSPISAAVILADKSDVHRSRVRTSGQIDLDIHDRVNYAVEKSFLNVNENEKLVTLELTIDTAISQVMEYFEIFMTRMLAARKAALYLGTTFGLSVNGNRLT